MLCQNCQKRPANVHFTQVINNHSIEMYLCEQCAKEKGQLKFGMPLSINDFLSGFLSKGNTKSYTESQPGTDVCEKCGMSFEDFQRTGKIGCGNCYTVFGDRIKPILRRLHGSFEHTGKVPAGISGAIKNTREISMLQDLINKAVQSEEYEKAAEYRDKIKALQSDDEKQ